MSLCPKCNDRETVRALCAQCEVIEMDGMTTMTAGAAEAVETLNAAAADPWLTSALPYGGGGAVIETQERALGRPVQRIREWAGGLNGRQRWERPEGLYYKAGAEMSDHLIRWRWVTRPASEAESAKDVPSNCWTCAHAVQCDGGRVGCNAGRGQKGTAKDREALGARRLWRHGVGAVEGIDYVMPPRDATGCPGYERKSEVPSSGSDIGMGTPFTPSEEVPEPQAGGLGLTLEETVERYPAARTAIIERVQESEVELAEAHEEHQRLESLYNDAHRALTRIAVALGMEGEEWAKVVEEVEQRARAARLVAFLDSDAASEELASGQLMGGPGHLARRNVLTNWQEKKAALETAERERDEARAALAEFNGTDRKGWRDQCISLRAELAALREEHAGTVTANTDIRAENEELRAQLASRPSIPN